MGYSYSMLAAAHTCQRKYWHQFINKTEAAQELSGDLAFGSALHMGLESLLRGDSLEDAIAAYDIYWNAIEGKPYTYGRHGWKALGEMGPMFLRKFAKTYLADIKPVQIEERLYLEGEDSPAFEGTPDCIGEFKGVLSVIDFKTSSQNYLPEQALVGEQMMLYAHMAQKHGHAIKQVVYIVFNKGTGSIQRPVVQELTQLLVYERLCNMEQYIESDLKDKAYAHQFSQNTSNCFKYSRKCEYFNACHGHHIKTEETKE